LRRPVENGIAQACFETPRSPRRQRGGSRKSIDDGITDDDTGTDDADADDAADDDTRH